MSTEPDNLVLQLLRDMRAEMATKADIADLRSEIHSLRADVASDFIEVRREITGVRKDLGEQIVGLRRAVVEYHTSVIGHGILISELEARLRRVEQHLDLPPLDAH
ncbi:hypothetical protein [Lichenibacterium ramalinae]|uniref:Uncharacterized protein n=1 Tax=Lichenibacterium ramalinae TaxID=2316527 RepID=A0A4Q2RFB0_9HYPH|nr:hypothetical protein [Lichenibacterium ramalinae]RYB05939.1 hypothetical protein D3272_07005 [Lichenibacterium ramalinae]